MDQTSEMGPVERSIAGPLDELDDRALYGLLGDAWYSQTRLVPGSGVYLSSSGVLAQSVEVGKREFDAVVPMLRTALDQPYRFGVVACVARALKTSSRWRMPAPVVAVLAVREGIALSRDRAVRVQRKTSRMSNMRAANGAKASNADGKNSARLEDLDDNALYWLLGDAWYAQLHPAPGSGLYLAPSAEVGKREFDAVVPMLRAAFAQPSHLGIVGCVAQALRTSGAWWMSASVVGVLAVRRGFTLRVDRRAPADADEACLPLMRV